MKLTKLYPRILNRISDRNWLIIRFIVFPVMVIAPFLLSPTAAPTCFPLHYVGNGIYEAGMAMPKENTWFLSFFILLLFALVALRAPKPHLYSEKRRFALKQIGVSVGAIAFTIPIFTYVYNHSLQKAAPSFGYSDKCVPIGTWPKESYGFGMSWQVLMIIAMIYLLVPLVAYYRLFLSRRHIGDVKKEKLFQ